MFVLRLPRRSIHNFGGRELRRVTGFLPNKGNEGSEPRQEEERRTRKYGHRRGRYRGGRNKCRQADNVTTPILQL